MGKGHPSASTFRTTSWTLILRAQGSRADLTALLETYRNPIYAYFKRKVRQSADAEDLTQEFIRQAVLENHVLAKADPARGRFRSFLITLLNRFMIDKHRENHGRSGDRPKTIVSSDSALLCADRANKDDDPTAAYDQEYFRTVLELVRKRLEDQCLAEGLEQHWQAYEARIMRPVYGGRAATVEELAGSMGIRGSQVSHMIETVKRKSNQVLRDVITDTLDDISDLDDEISALHRHVAD